MSEASREVDVMVVHVVYSAMQRAIELLDQGNVKGARLKMQQYLPKAYCASFQQQARHT